MTTLTTGTGTVSLEDAVDGCLSFFDAGVQDGDIVSYGIVDGNESEVGRGVYTASGVTLSRTLVLASTNGGSKISLSGEAQVYVTALAQDFNAGSVLFSFENLLQVFAGTLRVYNLSGQTKIISRVFLSLDTASGGAAIVVDIHKNGVTIFTDQAHRPSISSSSHTGSTVDIDVPSWEDGDYLTMDIDQVGISPNGSDLVVHVVF